jgi:hypothetical protein
MYCPDKSATIALGSEIVLKIVPQLVISSQAPDHRKPFTRYQGTPNIDVNFVKEFNMVYKTNQWNEHTCLLEEPP